MFLEKMKGNLKVGFLLREGRALKPLEYDLMRGIY